MITIRQLLATKSRDLYTVSATDSVAAALDLLARHRIGALMVMEGDRLEGIVSERDCALKVTMRGRMATEVTVGEIMTRSVITVLPSQPLEDCMQQMTERDIRHLPVVDGGRVVGMVSIGDVVKEVLRQQRYLIQQLESYIRGAYTGGGR
ncbi:MAG: CBS domain-containing protein [Pseudomonadota bacterium]|jgi:CBS domain-containing protein